MVKFIKKNFRMPKLAYENLNEKVQIIVEFVVTETSAITAVKTLSKESRFWSRRRSN